MRWYLYDEDRQNSLTGSEASWFHLCTVLEVTHPRAGGGQQLARFTTTVFGLLLMATILGVSDVRADLAKWDQAKVTAGAEALAQATVVLRDGLRAKPPGTLGQPGRRAFFSLREEVQVLVSTSRRLQRALANGAGMEETYPTFRRLVRAGRRGVREIRRIDLGKETRTNVEAVADGIRKLRPYYEPEPPI